MNLVDTLLALVIAAGMAAGWRRGFLLGTLGLAVLIASLLLAFWTYRYPANELETRALLTPEWVLPVAFLGTFILVRILLGAIANRVVAAVPQRAHKHRANRAMGLLPGLVDGLLYAMVLSLLLLALPLGNDFATQARDSAIASRLVIPGEWLESELAPIFQPAVSKTMNRMVVQPGSRERVPLSFTVQNTQPRPDLEARLLQLLNEERVGKGLRPLRADPELTEVARAHSRDMLARGYFSHISPEGKDPFDRMRQAKVVYHTAGENLALAPTVSLAHQALMNSPGHRANILRPAFGRVGIGVMDGGKHGGMATQVFRN